MLSTERRCSPQKSNWIKEGGRKRSSQRFSYTVLTSTGSFKFPGRSSALTCLLYEMFTCQCFRLPRWRSDEVASAAAPCVCTAALSPLTFLLRQPSSQSAAQLSLCLIDFARLLHLSPGPVKSIPWRGVPLTLHPEGPYLSQGFYRFSVYHRNGKWAVKIVQTAEETNEMEREPKINTRYFRNIGCSIEIASGFGKLDFPCPIFSDWIERTKSHGT